MQQPFSHLLTPGLEQYEPCAYLPGETACLPLSFPKRLIAPRELDELLAAGFRRSGMFFYRPACPACQACEAIRLDLTQFRGSRTQRRLFRRTSERVAYQLRQPVVSAQHVDIFNRHRTGRGLDTDRQPLTAADYTDFLVRSPVSTWELSYFHEQRQVGTAILDRGQDSVSAVYCCYLPEFAFLNLGTYSILLQAELCREWETRYLYLGLYIADCSHMNYKARFHPHERRIAGRWERFDSFNRPKTGEPPSPA